MSLEYFVELDRFLSERWLRDGFVLNIYLYLLMLFGYGFRMCVGIYCLDLVFYIKDLI